MWSTDNPDSWQNATMFEGPFEIDVACQGFIVRTKFLQNLIRSMSASVLFEIAIFLILYRCIRYLLLKAFGMPYNAQIIAGFIVGPIFGIYANKLSVNTPALLTISQILGYIGFFLHIFITGLELNFRKLTKVGTKALIIAFAGIIVSGSFTYTANKVIVQHIKGLPRGMMAILVFNVANYLMSTSSHLNDLGMSNSKLGQLAASASFFADMTKMIISIVVYYIMFPLFEGGEGAIQALVVFYYASIFLIFKPLMVYLVNLTPEGKRMKHSHFVVIMVLVLILSLTAQMMGQVFSPFLLALVLPEEPLASVLNERLDPLASGVFFPFFVMTRGMYMGFGDCKKDIVSSYAVAGMLAVGSTGKFIGTLASSLYLRLPWSQAMAMSFILSARGILDMATLDGMTANGLISTTQYTIGMVFSLITMGVFLPIVKFLYEPSRQYSTIMRHSVIDFEDNNETLQMLACIHKEESLPGLMRVLKVCHSTPEKPISLIALQLLQLTGRCAMPIMAPLHEVSSISALKSNIERCTSIVNSFLYLERETEGRTHTQHFVAMSPYATMHNDICNLAYEKTVGLVLIPFHTIWGTDGSVKESSLSIREVNNMVLQKAPCSVGILIDRSNMNEIVVETNVYRIAIVFIGGADDYEALAYSRLFANHPSVRLDVIWFKSPNTGEKNEIDYEVMKQFHKSCKNNARICFKEFIVNNGAETVQVMVSMKDQFDLVMTGKHHSLTITSLMGLSDGWTEYPELGLLGDIFASSDFEFSLLILQQEPQTEFALDFKQN